MTLSCHFCVCCFRYDENGFIKIVDANFILWEIHGRNDYTFNSTMEQNGCINEAQTWDAMIEENPGIPLDDVWGPQVRKGLKPGGGASL